MNSAERLKFDYPQNLIYDIAHHNQKTKVTLTDPERYEEEIITNIIQTNSISESQQKGLDYVLDSFLSEKEKNLVLLRYKDRLYFYQCGEEMGIAKQTIQANLKKILSRLEYPGYRKFITMGYDYMMNLKSIDYENQPISNLNIPMKAYRSIRYSDVRTIGQLVYMIENDMHSFYLMRSMGRPNVKLVLEELYSNGLLKHTVNHYLVEFDLYASGKYYKARLLQREEESVT